MVSGVAWRTRHPPSTRGARHEGRAMRGGLAQVAASPDRGLPVPRLLPLRTRTEHRACGSAGQGTGRAGWLNRPPAAGSPSRRRVTARAEERGRPAVATAAPWRRTDSSARGGSNEDRTTAAVVALRGSAGAKRQQSPPPDADVKNGATPGRRRSHPRRHRRAQRARASPPPRDTPCWNGSPLSSRVRRYSHAG